MNLGWGVCVSVCLSGPCELCFVKFAIINEKVGGPRMN